MNSRTKRLVQVRYGKQNYIVSTSVLDAPAVKRHYLNWASSCEVQAMAKANGNDEEGIRIANELVGPQTAHYKRLLDQAIIAEIEGTAQAPVAAPDWRKPAPQGVPLPPGRSILKIDKRADTTVIIMDSRTPVAAPVRDGIDFARGVLIAGFVAVIAFAALWAARGWIGAWL